MTIAIGVYLRSADQAPAREIVCKDARAMTKALRDTMAAPHVCLEPHPGAHAKVTAWDYSDPKVEAGALVFAVQPDAVYYVAKAPNAPSYDAHSATPADFAARYDLALPAYPLRRCARLLQAAAAGPRGVSDRAAKVLRHLLREGVG